MLRTLSNDRLLASDTRTRVVNVLSGLNFEIFDGDAIGVIGGNGSGKTSLLRLLSKIYHPSDGDLYLAGRVRSLLSLGTGLEPVLTGRENIRRMLLLFAGVFPDEETEERTIEFSGIGAFIDMPVRTYSSGMVMRLMFSCMVFDLPDIFIVDEFFSTGDEEFALKATKKMEEQIQNSNVFVFSSHQTELVKYYCNRFFQMDAGRLIEIGATDF